MDGIREYIVSVCAAAILCACVKSIIGEKGPTARIVKLVCGLFLAFTVIRPVAQIRITDFALMTADFQQEAEAAVGTGEEFVRESLADIIKEETEAYILDKAKALAADIQIEVTVSHDSQPIPKSVCITGKLSPYAKVQLQKILEDDLGIPKEGQLWIG